MIREFAAYHIRQKPRPRQALGNGSRRFIRQNNLRAGLGGGLLTASADIFDLDMLNTHKVGRNAFYLPTGIPPHFLPPLLAYRTGFFRFRKVMNALLYRQVFHILYIPPSFANMPRGFCNAWCRCHARRGGVGRSGFCQGILGRFQRLFFQQFGKFQQQLSGADLIGTGAVIALQQHIKPIFQTQLVHGQIIIALLQFRQASLNNLFLRLPLPGLLFQCVNAVLNGDDLLQVFLPLLTQQGFEQGGIIR